MNTDANEKALALQAMRTAKQRAQEWSAETDPSHSRTPLPEKALYGPYPSGNRHERRRAAKLMRTKRG